MAKMIKCPTCQTQIEVPPAPMDGGPVIIKCPTCGKGLKIVVKKPAGSPPMGFAPNGSATGGGASNGSMAGGSMSGTVMGGSMAAMSYHGEPPPDNDAPNLDSVCEVCGKPADPDDLVEDNGKLLCRDCIKGARSKINRAAGGAELLDFKQPGVKVRRTGPITLSPSFFVAALAAVIFLATQAYLSTHEAPKGKGRAMASPVKTAKSGGPPTVAAAATQPTNETNAQATPAPSSQPASPETVAAIPQPAPPPATPTQPEATTPPPAPTTVAAVPTTPPASSIFNDNPAPAPQTPPAIPVPAIPTPTIPPAPAPLPPNVRPPGNDAIALGISKLNTGDYIGAKTAFTAAQAKAGRVLDKLTADQQTILVGLAAANLGMNDPINARIRLETILGNTNPDPDKRRIAKGEPTRSAVINNAIAIILKKQNAPYEYDQAAELMRAYLTSHAGDDLAANVFGTLIQKISAVPNVKPELIAPLYGVLDQYVDALAATDTVHVGQLKWGIEWKDRNVVLQYRAARGHTGAMTPPAQLQQELEAAQAKVLQIQTALDQAKASGGDVVGMQSQLRDAQATWGAAKMRMDQAIAPAPKPKWLDKVAPIVPETAAQ